MLLPIPDNNELKIGQGLFRVLKEEIQDYKKTNCMYKMHGARCTIQIHTLIVLSLTLVTIGGLPSITT